LLKDYAWKAFRKLLYYIYSFLTSALDEGEWSTLRTGMLSPWYTIAGNHWILVLVFFIADIGGAAERIVSAFDGLRTTVLQAVDCSVYS
jgi:hypothetical protein